MLDRPVPEVGLDRAGVDALVSQLKFAGMTKHVRVDLHFEAGSLGSAFYHRLETTLGERHAALTNKDKWRFGLLLALQAPEGTQFPAGQWMCRRTALLDSTDVQKRVC